MNKKVLIYGLCLALTFSLVGCGSKPTQEPQQEQETQDIQQTKESIPSTPTTQTSVKIVEDQQEVDTTATPIEEGQKNDTGIVGEAGETEGAGSEEPTAPVEELFTEVNETVYATGTVNLRNGPGTENEKVGSLNRGQSVNRIGIGIEGTEAEGWSLVKIADGSIVYVSSNYLSTTKPVTQHQQTNKPNGNSSSTQQNTTQQTQQPIQQQTPSEPVNNGMSAAEQRQALLDQQTGMVGATSTYTPEELEAIGRELNGG